MGIVSRINFDCVAPVGVVLGFLVSTVVPVRVSINKLDFLSMRIVASPTGLCQRLFVEASQRLS